VPISTEELAALIATRLEQNKTALQQEWRESQPTRHAVIDDLLPPDVVRALYEHMPPSTQLALKKSLRERKRVGVDVRSYDPIIGAHLFAFQDPRVVQAVTEITGIAAMRADPTLYASGISVMARGDFLNPHLDNSHDGDQRDYRVLNLLFYATPGWHEALGGSLELWDRNVRTAVEVEARFNRLVLMETSRTSWHSVKRIESDRARVCVSNYYFSPAPPDGISYRNVTSFRGRPERPMQRAALWIDRHALNAIGRLFPWLLRRNPHRMR